MLVASIAMMIYAKEYYRSNFTGNLFEFLYSLICLVLMSLVSTVWNSKIIADLNRLEKLEQIKPVVVEAS